MKGKRIKIDDARNCPRDGTPYERQAGLMVYPKCRLMRSLDYEPNPYYSRPTRLAPVESIDGGTRKLPLYGDDA